MASEQKKSTTNLVVMVVIALIILAAVVYLYLRQSAPPEEHTATSLPVAVAPAEESAVVNQEPVTPVYEAPKPEPQEEPLPALGESDAALLTAFGKLSPASLKLIVPEESLRKFVRAVNAAEEGKVVHEYRPLTSPTPPFLVSRSTTEADQPEQFLLGADSFHRYDQFANTLAMIDTDALVAVYKRFYPLLEEAYSEMGLKKGNFHTVMMAAIDNILAAPVIDGEIRLVRPKVFYQYADPALEKLPATHQLMIRMGPDNTRSIKASLKTLKIKLAKQ